MKQYQIRVIAKYKEGDCRFGITVPQEVISFYPPNTSFTVELINTGSMVGFMFLSGTKQEYTKEEIKNYQFEDIRV